MVSLVHDSGGGIEPLWPSSGVAEGDLALVARRWTSSSGVRFPNPSPGPQWVGLGNYGTRSQYSSHWRAGLFWWQVRGASLPSIGPGSSLTAVRLLIFRGTAGIGRARTGQALVPVSENGGAIAIGVEASTAGDLTILPGSGSVSVGWGAASSDGVFGNSGWNHSHTRIYELLPPAGPLAPLVLAPGDGAEVSAAEPVEFEWQHRPSVSGGRQDAYQLRAWEDGGEPSFWNASTGAWTSGEVTNQSAVQGASLPASAFSVNVPMSWQVRTREGVDGRWSAWSSAASFTPVVPPSVSVTGPGNLHDDLSPTVTWTAVTPRGVQSAFRVQIARLGQVVYDSGARPGDAGEWTVEPREWLNGALYQARVQVQQTGGSWSPWDTRDFTISWTEPAVPSVEPWSADDGVLVHVVADPGLAVDLERITGEGLWVPVDSFTMPDTGHVTVTDVRARLGQVTAYRARAVNELEGQRLVSGWGLSGQVINRSRWSYLFAAAAPLSTWVRCYLREDGPRTSQRPTSVAHGLGDEHPRVSCGTRRGDVGTLVLTAYTPEDRVHLDRLLHAGEPLGLRMPGEEGDEPGVRDGGELFFDVAGEVTVSRVATGPFQWRHFTVPWVEEGPPGPGRGRKAPAANPNGRPRGDSG